MKPNAEDSLTFYLEQQPLSTYNNEMNNAYSLGIVLDTSLFDLRHDPHIDYEYLMHLAELHEVYVTPYTALELFDGGPINRERYPTWLKNQDVYILPLKKEGLDNQIPLLEFAGQDVSKMRKTTLIEFGKLYKNLIILYLLTEQAELPITDEILDYVDELFDRFVNNPSNMTPYTWKGIIRHRFLDNLVCDILRVRTVAGAQSMTKEMILQRMAELEDKLPGLKNSNQFKLGDKRFFEIDEEIKLAVIAIQNKLRKNCGTSSTKVKLDIIDLLNAHASFQSELNLVTLSKDKELVQFILRYTDSREKEQIIKSLWKNPV